MNHKKPFERIHLEMKSLHVRLNPLPAPVQEFTAVWELLIDRHFTKRFIKWGLVKSVCMGPVGTDQ